MSTTPPESPETPPSRPSFFGSRAGGPPATLPIPGNAEFALYLVILIVFAIIWAASDIFDADGFVTAMTVLTAAYFLSRGIAKASRVYEQ